MLTDNPAPSPAWVFAFKFDRRWLALAPAVITLIVFWPSLGNGFVSWDDGMFLLEQTGWRGFRLENWLWAFRSSIGTVWQPLAYLSYELDFLWWGLDPFGFHLTSVLLHSISAALVYLISLELDEDAASPEAALAAVFAACFFALHPLRVESVSWISERRDVLCGALMFAALLTYLRAARRQRKHLWPVAVLQILAMLAKAQALILPALLLILDAWPLGRFRRAADRVREIRGAIREKTPLWILSMIVALITQNSLLQNRPMPLSQHGLGGRFAQAAYGFVFYARKTFWPTRLSPFYELYLPLDPFTMVHVACFLIVAVTLCLCWKLRRQWPWLPAGLAFFAGCIGPVSGLIHPGAQLVADRYSYVSCLPFALLAGASLRFFLRRESWRLAAVTACGGVIVALGVACAAQQAIWKDSESLWSHGVMIDPRSPTALHGLGRVRVDQGRFVEGQTLFNQVLALDGGCLAAQDKLARMRRAGSNDIEEMSRLSWEIERRPVCRRARLNRAATAAAMGDISGAYSEFETITVSNPEDRVAWANLEKARRLLGKNGQPR